MEEFESNSVKLKALNFASEEFKSDENYYKIENKLPKLASIQKNSKFFESQRFEEAEGMQQFVIGPYQQNYLSKRNQFKPNNIKTSQYSIWSFIPKNLFKQLSKMVNFYFLIVMVLQVIKPISISRGQPIILFPLLFVISLAGFKDLIEDIKRHKSDNIENNRKCLVANKGNKQMQEIEWSKIKVGMIVKIKKNEYFPADLLLLSSSDNKGICYIETKTIDGETNLKHKCSIRNIASMLRSDEDAMNFQALIQCEKPNEMIYRFNGVIAVDDSQSMSSLATVSKQMKFAVGFENFLLRGASLKSTDFVYGAVIYTGHDSKIMKNSTKVRHKMSKVEKALQIQVAIIFAIELCLCMFCAMYGTLWEKANAMQTQVYLELDARHYSTRAIWFKDSFKRIGTWMLIFTNIIPISMQATLDCVKLAQGFFISWDVQVYDQTKDLPAQVQSSNLNEELGQLSYLFTDKTGTLTQNNMEFKKFSAGFFSYGKSGSNYKQYIAQRRPDLKLEDLTHVNFEDPDYFSHVQDPTHETFNAARELLIFLAVCHTIVIENKGGQKVLNSSSPDELALVQGARYLGFSFVDRDKDNNILVEILGEGLRKFQLLHVIEFSSERKRMSVIIKDENNCIRLLCKGADTVISERLSHTVRNQELLNQTTMFQTEYATEGLRTLLLAQKVISSAELNEWTEAYQRAGHQLLNKDELMAQEADRIERELELIGSTAIEDKLQEEVGETIAAIKEAGINIWVLTGDKVETAINIGYSCNLLDNNIAQSIIDGKNYQDLLNQVGDAQKQQVLCIGSRQEQAIIISGESLLLIQCDYQILERFIEISQKADVIIACRVSPKQKADIVQMIRNKHPSLTTLAVGDGANDVNMINQAHVGIGISGLEGQQAARSSDYAIGQFKHLRQLLFVHGREAYRRNSYLICYIFYKNILFVVPQFFFGFETAFSGASLYEPWLYQLYNIVFTAVPIIWYAIFDFEYTKEQLYSTPKYYLIGPSNSCFNSKRFWAWLCKGTGEGLLLLFLIVYSFEVNALNQVGQPCSIWVTGAILYQSIVMICNLQLIFQSHTHTFWSALLQFLSVISFFGVYYLENLFENVPELFETFYYIWSANQFYFLIIFEMQITFFYENLQMYFLDMSTKYLFKMRGRRGSLQRFMIRQNQIEQEFSPKNYVVMEHHGFAFSQEPGHAPQLIQDLELAYIRFNSFQRYINSMNNELEGEVHEAEQFSDNARFIMAQHMFQGQHLPNFGIQSISNINKMVFAEEEDFHQVMNQTINSPNSHNTSFSNMEMRIIQNAHLDSQFLGHGRIRDDERIELTLANSIRGKNKRVSPLEKINNTQAKIEKGKKNKLEQPRRRPSGKEST